MAETRDDVVGEVECTLLSILLMGTVVRVESMGGEEGVESILLTFLDGRCVWVTSEDGSSLLIAEDNVPSC